MTNAQAFFAQWLASRLSKRVLRLSRAVRVTKEYTAHHGGRNSFASVTLHAEPAVDFSFSSNGAWATEADREGYESHVTDAIGLVLVSYGHGVPSGMRLTLEEALVHEVDSNGNAFFRATVSAMEEALGMRDMFCWNVDHE